MRELLGLVVSARRHRGASLGIAIGMPGDSDLPRGGIGKHRTGPGTRGPGAPAWKRESWTPGFAGRGTGFRVREIPEYIVEIAIGRGPGRGLEDP